LDKTKIRTKVSESSEEEELEEEDDDIHPQRKEKMRLAEGEKTLKDKPSQGAIRVLLDAPQTSPRPVSVYKERVTSAKGEVVFVIWYTREDSKVVGKENVVEINPRSLIKKVVAVDYTILYSKEEVQKLLKLAFHKTKFYHKDGSSRINVDNPAVDF